MQLDPTLTVLHNDLAKAVATQVKLLKLEGLPRSRPNKRHWWLVLDQDAVRGVQQSLKGNALAKEPSKSIHAEQCKQGHPREANTSWASPSSLPENAFDMAALLAGIGVWIEIGLYVSKSAA